MASEASEKVVAIRPSIGFSEGKQMFLDLLADTYDQLAESKGPAVALTLSLVTEAGAAKTSYLTLSSIEDRNCLHLSRALCALQADYQRWAEGSGE